MKALVVLGHPAPSSLNHAIPTTIASTWRDGAALVINTGNTRARDQAVFRDPLERIWRDCVLQYCGIRHVLRSLFGVVATSDPVERERWVTEAKALATQAHDLVC
jgi:hypothetical protein